MTRKIVAILRGVKPAEVLAVGEVILEAGISVIEVPLNSPEPYASIATLAGDLGASAVVGAGTVLGVGDVERVHDAGGALVVSPDCNTDVIARTKALGMQSFPGVLTPTECFAALGAGADGLKIFPAGVLGTSGLGAVRAVLPPETEIYAVGGVGPENFAAWIAAGATGFGIGSGIFRPGMSFAEVRDRARDIVAAYDRVVGEDTSGTGR